MVAVVHFADKGTEKKWKNEEMKEWNMKAVKTQRVKMANSTREVFRQYRDALRKRPLAEEQIFYLLFPLKTHKKWRKADPSLFVVSIVPAKANMYDLGLNQ